MKARNYNNIFRRAVITWVIFIPVVFLNAAFRELVYKSYIRELAAHQISTVIASAAFFILAYVHLRNHLQTIGRSSLLLIGCMWLVMTVVFEFTLGHFINGASWFKLLHDYNILEGRIWVLLLITIFVTPLTIKQLINTKTSHYQFSK